MTPNERLTLAAEALSRTDTDVISDINADEVAKIAVETEILEKDYDTLVGIIIYIRKRLVDKTGRVGSFKAAFPSRCIYSGSELGGYTTDIEIGTELHQTTIDVKAKRLEASSLYKKIYTLMQTGLYISYAVERLKVLDIALDAIYDNHTADRDKAAYMKLFLEETRKPENAKELEVNFNLTQNNISIASVEDKMNTIAQALNHASAAEVIEMVHHKSSDDN